MDQEEFVEQEEQKIIDIDDSKEEPAFIQYDITSYGADYTVDGLTKKLIRGDIYIPEFQRNFVWNQSEASKLIESLLLGLPVPGIFLAKEGDSNKLLVIDGQQRLRSLQFYMTGFFDPKEGAKTKRVFKLVNVQKKFEGKTFAELEDNDKLMIEDSIIHSTIIKQESPAEDNTAIYHVFERLNSGGKKLTPQEIRAAVYHGSLNNLISELNELIEWRNLFGPISQRLKDQELILRFLAVRYSKAYFRPMNEFLNIFNKKYRDPGVETLNMFKKAFVDTITFLNNCIGSAVFRPEGVFNVSAFESITVNVSVLLQQKGQIDCDEFRINYASLIANDDYKISISRATSDESVFITRQKLTRQFLHVD